MFGCNDDGDLQDAVGYVLTKKFQVFISSTYRDLIEERQVAVRAVLEAGHIPAGMELFTASDETQWDVIKKWIDESDVFLLILGGRYGSLNSVENKSYTHMEYEYALKRKKHGMRLFTVVLSDEFLKEKSKVPQIVPVCDLEFNPNYCEFKNLVKNTLIKQVKNKDELSLEIVKALHRFEKDQLSGGWVRVKGSNCISWEEYGLMVRELSSKIKTSGSNGGFTAKIIVGINKGGLMTATLLTRCLKDHDTPVLGLFADRQYVDRQVTVADFESSKLTVSNLHVINALKSEEIRNILLVDSISRNDITLERACKYLKDNLPGKIIKTALLIQDDKCKMRVDYHLKKQSTKDLKLPYQEFSG